MEKKKRKDCISFFKNHLVKGKNVLVDWILILTVLCLSLVVRLFTHTLCYILLQCPLDVLQCIFSPLDSVPGRVTR